MNKSKQAERPDMTNKKLQKLLFYTQAWSLVLNDEKIIDDRFEAWIHGAVIPSLYGRYKKFGFQQIIEDYDTSEFNQLTESEKQLLDEVWEVYGMYDPDYLEELNHSEMPWQKARMNTSPLEVSKAIISEEDMKAYYGEKLKKAKSQE
jgi:uncharacterized phage-associated protein